MNSHSINKYFCEITAAHIRKQRAGKCPKILALYWWRDINIIRKGLGIDWWRWWRWKRCGKRRTKSLSPSVSWLGECIFCRTSSENDLIYKFRGTCLNCNNSPFLEFYIAAVWSVNSVVYRFEMRGENIANSFNYFCCLHFFYSIIPGG